MHHADLKYTPIISLRRGEQVKVFLELTSGHHEDEGALIIVIVGEASDFSLSDDGSGDYVTNTEDIIVLLVCKDVLGSDHCLGRSVLTGLDTGEGGDLAWPLNLHDD